MRSIEERLEKMHERAGELQRRRDRTVTTALGAASVGLMVCLVWAVAQLQHISHGISSASNTGSSLLSESAGGYVLIAVLAFAAGVVITAWIFRYRNRRK